MESLDEASKTCYKDKIIIIIVNDKDPYCLSKDDWSVDASLFPPVTFPDVFMYLIHTKSPYTMQELKSNKNLDAYNHVTSGWVRDVKVHQHTAERSIISGRVSNCHVLSLYFNHLV